MRILVISGSARKQSSTGVIASNIRTLLKGPSIEVLNFDVAVHTLPLYAGDPSEESHLEVQRLRSYADQADGFIICTPEYHSGISGSLKNALDFLGFPHFKGKPSVIVAAAGGGKGGINALNNLRTVLRGVYANVLADQLVIDKAQIDAGSGTIEPVALQKLDILTRELVRTVDQIALYTESLQSRGEVV
ncbi:NADPH-dependent FMN reductase [Paenibacillus sp. FJAT-26967]|uniref:NADPH-dependent FMN reductase n=1 Tax=Paenibacillus sp. FJAT-26967 TaxID=1729690 RepID=UPI0009FF4FF6|nr:NADPH-dependent FMN reductase [Paenibacillus sp. FJAT-26967]